MNRVAIVTDSNSGITQKQAQDMGIYVLPMPFQINEETYFEDIDLSQEEFYTKLEEGANISTSQPTIRDLTKIWEDALTENEQVVHIPMSGSLSGSCETAMVIAKKFDGKVHVVDNRRISVTQRQSVLDGKMLAEKGKSALDICKILENTKMESSIYITLNTLQYLKKGGRITPTAAAIGTLLKLKPVLQIQGGKLDAFVKARTMSQAKSKMISAIQGDIETRFGGNIMPRLVRLHIAHTNNETGAEEFRHQLEEIFPDYEIYVDHLSLSVSCHIGPGALAIACTKNIAVLSVS